MILWILFAVFALHAVVAAFLVVPAAAVSGELFEACRLYALAMLFFLVLVDGALWGIVP